MVHSHGIVEGDGVIRLHGPLAFPAGTRVKVTLEVEALSIPEEDPEKVERRKRAIDRILAREPINICPHTVRDLIEDGRDR
ncbi:hypothetical protein ACFL59_10895 [Planctomycetota bacterium]